MVQVDQVYSNTPRHYFSESFSAFFFRVFVFCLYISVSFRQVSNLSLFFLILWSILFIYTYYFILCPVLPNMTDSDVLCTLVRGFLRVSWCVKLALYGPMAVC